MSKEQRLEEIKETVIDMAAEYPRDTLTLLTGLFVGLVVHAAQQAGADPGAELIIDGGEQRDITVHAVGRKASHTGSSVVKSARELELEDLLRSAHAIAVRKGEDVAWERFAESIKGMGIGAVTARVYRVLADDAGS